MNGFISEFGLTYKQTCLLFSLERQIIVNDIINTKANNKPEEAIRKQTWLDAWTDNINNFLEGLNKKEKKNEECECPAPSSKPDIAKIDNNNLLEEILQEYFLNVLCLLRIIHLIIKKLIMRTSLIR